MTELTEEERQEIIDLRRIQRYHIYHVPQSGKRKVLAIVECTRRRAREQVRQFKQALGRFENVYEEWVGPPQNRTQPDE